MDVSDRRDSKANKKVMYVDGWGGRGLGLVRDFLNLFSQNVLISGEREKPLAHVN